MQRSKDKTADGKQERKSGRVAFNETGNAVWEWQTATGVFERFISDEKMSELTGPHLALVEDHGPRKYEGLWVHDLHRPVKPVEQQARVDAKRSVRPLRTLLRKLSFT